MFVPRHHCSDEAHEHALPEAILAETTLPAEYRAPSWSWASIDGEIEFENIWLSTTAPEAQEKVAQDVHVTITQLGNLPYGRAKTGFISFKVGFSFQKAIDRANNKRDRLSSVTLVLPTPLQTNKPARS